MARFTEIFEKLVVMNIRGIRQSVIEWGPKIALSILILLIGWVSAVILKKITTKLLRIFGFDVVSEKAGFSRFLANGGVNKKPSGVIGLVLYWVVIFSALIMAFDCMDLPMASEMINQTIAFIPKMVVALILIALGIFLGRFFSILVKRSTQLAHIPFSPALGEFARFAVIILALVVTVEYLDLKATVIDDYLIIILAIVPLFIISILLIGGRDLISSIIAGRFLIREYKKGEMIEFDSISGKIESVDLVSTRIGSEEATICVPNAELARKIIKRKKQK